VHSNGLLTHTTWNQSEAITYEKQNNITAEQQSPSSQPVHLMMAGYAEICSDNKEKMIEY
jgi:hypothetical protein